MPVTLTLTNDQALEVVRQLTTGLSAKTILKKVPSILQEKEVSFSEEARVQAKVNSYVHTLNAGKLFKSGMLADVLGCVSKQDRSKVYSRLQNLKIEGIIEPTTHKGQWKKL